MTNDEVIDLLTLMASYDRRTVGKADVAAWGLVVGDLLFADAEQAVVAHYTDSRDFAMPVDILRRVKAARADRIRRSVVEAPPPELADNPAAYQKALQANIRAAGDGHALPVADMPRAAITGPAVRGNGPPTRLGAALGELRRRLGPARRRAIEAPQDTARRQADEARASRPADADGTEAAS